MEFAKSVCKITCCLFLFPTFFPDAQAALEQDKTLSLEQVRDYYSSLSFDWIKPTEAGIIDELVRLGQIPNQFVLKNDRRWKNRIEPYGHKWDSFVTEKFFFQTDVQKYTDYFLGTDFLTAKEMQFLPPSYQVGGKEPILERYFHPMSYWSGLGHPPITPDQMNLPLADYYEEFGPFNIDEVESKLFSSKLQKQIDQETQTELTYGNKLKILPNRMAYDEKLRMVKEAKTSFHVAVLYFKCDSSTNVLVDEMIKAVERGVDVRFMTEGAFMVVEKPCIKRMRKGGIEVLGINDTFKPISFYGVMHNKLWIRDSVEAIVGGQNLMDAENLATGFNHLDRDTDLLIESGPGVTDVVYGYASLWEQYRHNSLYKKIRRKKRTDLASLLNWSQAKKEQERAQGLRGSDNYERWLGNKETRMNGICRVAVQDAGAQSQNIAKIMYRLLENSEKSFLFTSPTLTYNPQANKKQKLWMNNQLAELLKRKAQDGMKVEVITNSFDGGNGELTIIFRNLMNRAKRNQNKFVEKFFSNIHYRMSKMQAFSFSDNLKDFSQNSNMRAWTYFQYTHSKNQLFDRVVSSVGSWNFDFYSAERSHETQVYCFDRKLRDDLEKMFVLDLINSIPYMRK